MYWLASSNFPHKSASSLSLLASPFSYSFNLLFTLDSSFSFCYKSSSYSSISRFWLTNCSCTFCSTSIKLRICLSISSALLLNCWFSDYKSIYSLERESSILSRSKDVLFLILSSSKVPPVLIKCSVLSGGWSKDCSSSMTE